MIPKEFIDTLLNSIDIVEDVIGVELTLKKQGDNYVCNCPFHNEKSPSFSVSSSKQFYHCFGCKASGNALKFLMEYRGLTFIESIEQLAKTAGLEVPRDNRSVHKDQFNDDYQTLELACKFFEDNLIKNKNVTLQFQQRGIQSEIIERYRLGFAELSWDQCLNYFQQLHQQKKLQITGETPLEKKLQQLSLLSFQERKQKYFDRFRNRLIFPISDYRGRIIGFGGRVIVRDDNPKYLNSSEHELFQKSHIVYGLYQCLKSRQREEYFLVVEGYMDVCSLAQNGFNNAVATLGTAVTEHHMRQLFRYQNRIVFCFDGDSAGQKAAEKALQVCLPQLEDGRIVKFIHLPEGKDPDDIVRQEGRAHFQKIIERADSLDQYIFSYATKGFDTNSADEIGAVLQKSLALIAKIPSYLTREGLLSSFSKRTNIAVKVLEKQLESLMSSATELKKTAQYELQNATQRDSTAEKAKATTITVNCHPENPFNKIIFYLVHYPALYQELSDKLQFEDEVFQLDSTQKLVVEEYVKSYNCTDTTMSSQDIKALFIAQPMLNKIYKSLIRHSYLAESVSSEKSARDNLSASIAIFYRIFKHNKLKKQREIIVAKPQKDASDWDNLDSIAVQLKKVNRSKSL